MFWENATRRSALGALLLAALPLASTPFGATPTRAGMEVEHAKGRTTLADRPRTVLVFDIAALDTLDALNVPVAGVPGSNLPDYLGKYRDDRYVKIGTLFEPDYEAVAASAPDLIIVGPRSSAKYADLSQIAPTIDLSIDPMRFIAGTRLSVELLGRVFDRQEEAAALVARIDGAMAHARKSVPGDETVLMVMVNGGKLTAFGPGSRFGWIYRDLGLKPAGQGTTTAAHGEVISFEYILKTNPDWLLVLDRDAAVGHGGQAARAALDNELISATSAAQKGQIVYVDPVRWYISAGGGAALAVVAEELATAFTAARATGK